MLRFHCTSCDLEYRQNKRRKPFYQRNFKSFGWTTANNLPLTVEKQRRGSGSEDRVGDVRMGELR